MVRPTSGRQRAGKPGAWQHSVLTKVVPLGALAQETDTTKLGNDIANGLAYVVSQMDDALRHPPDGMTEAEALSHSLVLLGDTLIVTMLVRYRADARARKASAGKGPAPA